MTTNSLTEWQTRTEVRDDIALNYVLTGNDDKPWLVLCHGLTDNGLCWQRTAEAMTPHFNVVMPDARNHGETGDGPASSDDTAADIAHIMSALHADSAVVIGHSVGAATAASLARDFPERVNRLIVEDPVWRLQDDAPGEEQSEKQHKAFAAYVEGLHQMSEADIIASGKRQHPKWDELDLPAWAAAKKKVRADAYRLLNLSNWRETVPGISCPSLLIFGDQKDGCDGIVTADVAREVIALNSSFSSTHIPGAGHNLRREKFQAFIQAIDEFLELTR